MFGQDKNLVFGCLEVTKFTCLIMDSNLPTLEVILGLFSALGLISIYFSFRYCHMIIIL